MSKIITSLLIALILAGCTTQYSRESASGQLQPKPTTSRSETEQEIQPEGEGLSSTSMQLFNDSFMLTRDVILQTEAVTVCALKALATPPVRDKVYRNNLVGELFIEQNFMARMSNQSLTYVADPSYDNAIPVRIDQHVCLLVMERQGDRIKLDDTKPASPPLIGVGSEVRFDDTSWVPFLGSSYRGGGFKVTRQGIVYLEGTQRQTAQGKEVFNGTNWMPTDGQ